MDLTPSLTQPRNLGGRWTFRAEKERRSVLGVHSPKAQRGPETTSFYSGGPQGHSRGGSGWAPRSAGSRCGYCGRPGSSCPRPWGPPGPRSPPPAVSPHHRCWPTPSAELGHTLTLGQGPGGSEAQLRTADSEGPQRADCQSPAGKAEEQRSRPARLQRACALQRFDRVEASARAGGGTAGLCHG